MENFDITLIIEALLGLIVAIVTTIIFPKLNLWVKGNLTKEQISIIKIIVSSAVSAAEQIFNESGSGEYKKEYVLDFLQGKLAELGLTFNESEIEVYLEEAVLELNKNIKQFD